MVHGAGAAEALLDADELDEMEIHLVPAILGSPPPVRPERKRTHLELELVRRLEGRDATHMRYVGRR
jgi:riboflavin biosynthesis pyrimidine reductase